MNRSKIKNVFFIIFLFLCAVAALLYGLYGESISLARAVEYIDSFGAKGPIVFMVIYIIVTIFLPSTPLMILSGILFGFYNGLLYTVLAGFINSVIVFAASRQLGKDFIENLLSKKYLSKIERYNKRLEGGAISDLVILRILPIMPFNVLNIAMGVSKIKFKDYCIGTLIGLAPSNIFSVYAGAFLTKIF